MGSIQFLATLPAVLGLAGFVIIFLLRRNRGGDRITLDIIAKLRREAPGRLPDQAEKLSTAALTKIIEDDVTLRSKISDQEFQLLRDALHQQFIASLVVYGLCGVIFLVGVALYTYVSIRPIPVSITSISAQSGAPSADGMLVDLYPLHIQWFSAGEPEDVAISLEDVTSHRRSSAKTVRSTEGKIDFVLEEYRSILSDRSYGASNRLRAVFQSKALAFFSPEMDVHVGTTILAIKMDDSRLKIVGLIDNDAVPNYNFDARFLVWATHSGRAPELKTFGGHIQYGKNSFRLDPSIEYDWADKKLIYLGPDDIRSVRVEYWGF